jgi:hypothetical protein
MRALGALLLLFWVSYLCPTGLSTEKIEVDPNSTSADVYKRNNAGAIPSDILPTELPISHSCGVKDNGKKTVRSLRIMLSSTDEYFPVFLNWLVFYNKICPSISSLYMICLDPSVEMRIKKYGLSCASCEKECGITPAMGSSGETYPGVAQGWIRCFDG